MNKEKESARSLVVEFQTETFLSEELRDEFLVDGGRENVAAVFTFPSLQQLVVLELHQDLPHGSIRVHYECRPGGCEGGGDSPGILEESPEGDAPSVCEGETKETAHYFMRVLRQRLPQDIEGRYGAESLRSCLGATATLADPVFRPRSCELLADISCTIGAIVEAGT